MRIQYPGEITGAGIRLAAGHIQVAKRTDSPTVDNLVILADAFGVEVDDIIVRSNIEL